MFSGTIGGGKTVSAIAIGGATTVPTNATAVKMSVTVKSTAAGVLIVYPTGDQTAPGSQNVFYGAGTTNVKIQGTVGVKDEITFHNGSLASATVTVTDVGYSTQLTATNIAPDGGSPGQVLTNTGGGTAWSNSGQVQFAGYFAPSGGINQSGIPAFLGGAVPVRIDDANTVVEVTASTDFASSDGNPILSVYGICSAPPTDPSATTEWAEVAPQFQAPAHSYFAQTVSGVVGGLAPGNYVVGACTSDETPNVLHGGSAGTLTVVEGTSGYAHVGRRTAAQAMAAQLAAVPTVPSNR